MSQLVWFAGISGRMSSGLQCVGDNITEGESCMHIKPI